MRTLIFLAVSLLLAVIFLSCGEEKKPKRYEAILIKDGTVLYFNANGIIIDSGKVTIPGLSTHEGYRVEIREVK